MSRIHQLQHDPLEKVKDKFAGRGVVVLASNFDTIMQLKVILMRPRKLRPTIPLEVHYWANKMTEDNLKTSPAYTSPSPSATSPSLTTLSASKRTAPILASNSSLPRSSTQVPRALAARLG